MLLQNVLKTLHKVTKKGVIKIKFCHFAGSISTFPFFMYINCSSAVIVSFILKKGTVVPENLKEMYKCVRQSLNRMELVIFIESGSYIFFFHSSFSFYEILRTCNSAIYFHSEKRRKFFSS